MAKFVISLDFELFWGVAAAQNVAGYAANVRGEWQAVPGLLALFRRYGIRATWATVGMAMCRNYREWRDIRPAILPGYRRQAISPYGMDKLVREYPELFFARPLVEQILATSGQELASHTYSHFYCNEAGATPAQFAADMACASAIAAEVGTQCPSLVLPRNQIVEEFLAVLPDAGIRVYRGNADHWLYRQGDAVPGGIAGRAARFADGCLPLSGNCARQTERHGDLVNVPASLFLYPWSARHAALAPARLSRLKHAMTAAARTDGIFHLWWHPHNFGVNTEKNLAQLELLLQHYRILSEKYGIQSSCMGDFPMSAEPAAEILAPSRRPAAPASGRGAVRGLP